MSISKLATIPWGSYHSALNIILHRAASLHSPNCFERVLPQHLLFTVGHTPQPTSLVRASRRAPEVPQCKRRAANGLQPPRSAGAAAIRQVRVLCRSQLEETWEPLPHKSVEWRDRSRDDGEVALDGGVDKGNIVGEVVTSIGRRVVEEVDGAHAEDAEDGDPVKTLVSFLFVSDFI